MDTWKSNLNNLYNKDQRTFPCGRDVNIEENHIQQGGIFDYTTHGAAKKAIGGNKKILRYEIEEKWYEEGWLICI